MKSVLVSIQPPNTNNIFDGIKGIEWRTRPMPTGKHYCYETKNGGGVGKVVGQFFVWRISRFTRIDRIPSTLISYGCVSTDFLKEYSKGKPLYAHWIEEPQRYEKPIALSAFRKPIECHRGNERQNCVGCWDCEIKQPPQSWCYVEGEVDVDG